MKIGLAGAGIFAQKAHGPAILANPDLQLTAVFSRSAENARAVAHGFEGQYGAVAIFDDYDAFLRNADFTAVDVVLPTQIVGDAVMKALAAGKHVLSEKPIAGTVHEGQQMINFWRALDPRPAWLVSENWRFEEAFIHARRHLDACAIGSPLLFRCTCLIFRRPDSPYAQSGWRKASACGWLTDIGTHAVAALRLVFDAIPEVAAASRIKKDTQGGWTETVSASLFFPSQLLGEIVFAYAIGADVQTVFDIRIEVLGTEGKLVVDRSSLRLCRAKYGDQTERKYNCKTVSQALELWAKTARNLEGTNRENSLDPETALADLTVIEKIRNSLVVSCRAGIEL